MLRERRLSIEETLTPKMFEEEPDDSLSEQENLADDETSFLVETKVLEDYFSGRLIEIAEQSDLSEDCVNYQVKISRKMGGIAQGLFDVLYFDENGRKFKSRVDVILALQKETRKFRHHLFLSAQEYRERILLTQLTQDLYCSYCLHYENNTFIQDRVRKDVFFSFGNITVIEWGTITSNPEFHTQSYIFPIGFCCLRQEKDEFLDTIVDCLCEVDAFYVVDDRKEVLSELDVAQQEHIIANKAACLIPLFRITVAWNKDGGEPEIKVYEGKTPQVAWQGAMLESLRNFRAVSTINDSTRESEQCLRERIRESRRIYFRTMRQEQGKGNIEAVRPRILVDAAESFFDLNILKLIEGMEGSLSCKNYVFIESRSGDHLTKQLFNEFADSHQKLKYLDSIARVCVEQAVSETKKRKREEVEKSNERSSALIESVQVKKGDVLRRIKRDKEEAMMQIENVVRMEQSRINCREEYRFVPENLQASINQGIRPLPRKGKISIDGITFGRLLEIREFLKSLKKLGFSLSKIPSIEEFIVAYRKSYLRGKVESESKDFWTRIAVELTKNLYPEFEKVLGLDLVSNQLADIKLSINAATWKEILRLIIWNKLCRNLKLSDVEISAILKGRGYFTSPESADRKALKLIKKRLWYHYSTRNELQETLTGIENGIYAAVKIPRKRSFADEAQEILQICSLKEEISGWIFLNFIESGVRKIAEDYVNVDETLVKQLQRILTAFENSEIDQPAAKNKLIELFASRQIFLEARFCDVPVDGNYLMRTSRESMSTADYSFLSFEQKFQDSFNGTSEIEELDTLLERLPVLSQRCFTVLFNISHHPLMESINLDAELKSYRVFSLHHLTFLVIQTKLLSGQYGHFISRFYEDMSLVFETLLGYFSELSTQKQTVVKLSVIFERLFYEMVLTCECPLPMYGSCQLCRTSDIPSVGEFVVCDRCDGTFHLCCLEPPFELSTTPRAEWYCPFCIESRGVASAHPHRFSRILHSTKNCEGNVVGIETESAELMFVVDFGTFREKWTAENILANFLVKEDPNLGIIDFVDYNRACVLCCGYGGWGGSRLVMPPVLNRLVSADAKASTENELMETCFRILGFPDDFDSENWLKIFESIKELIFSVYSCQEMLPDASFQEEICSILGQAINLDNDIQCEAPSREISALSGLGERSDEEGSEVNEKEGKNDALQYFQGREDALLYSAVVQEILSEAEDAAAFEAVVESSEGASALIQKGFGFLGKFSERAMEEWVKGWDIVASSVSLNSHSRNCSLCGKSELDLCSPLTSFLNLNDWISKYGITIYQQGLISREMHQLLTKHYFIDFCWDGDIANTAHACCAEILNLRRASMVIARKHADNQFLLENVCKLGSPLTTPIGIDRDGCLYWVFDYPFQLYVGRPNSMNQLSEKNTTYDWYRYENEDIIQLYHWMSEENVSELALKRILRIVFPEVVGKKELLSWTSKIPTLSDAFDPDIQTTESPETSVLSTERILSMLLNASGDVSLHDLVYVLVRENLWLGKVDEIQKKGASTLWFKISFTEWGDGFSDWYDEKHVIPKEYRFICGSEDISLKRASKILRERYLLNVVSTPPHPINTLNAASWMRMEKRESQTISYGFSNCVKGDLISILKMAMLVIESALPIGAIDESEERWGNNFREIWREAVGVSADAVSLMQCQLMLEYGIRTAWLKPSGLKFFSCLPSRIHALRNACFSAVALRIWALDFTIKYDKLESTQTGIKKSKQGK